MQCHELQENLNLDQRGVLCNPQFNLSQWEEIGEQSFGQQIRTKLYSAAQEIKNQNIMFKENYQSQMNKTWVFRFRIHREGPL